MEYNGISRHPDNFAAQLTALYNKWGLNKLQSIQSLWSGYGEIARYHSDKLKQPVIIKQVQPNTSAKHPRGWNTKLSHQRKLFSYQAELMFYREYAVNCDENSPTPKLLDYAAQEEQLVLLLEDVDAAGFDLRKTQLDIAQIKHCLDWLAAFHGRFLHTQPEGLWQAGCYWHLATRPDELNAMADGALKQQAHAIDKKLCSARFQTLVHGDAKLANFCFSADSRSVIALDFQYVGGGPGIKDVMLFLGSCLDGEALFTYEQELLTHYFAGLKSSVEQHQPQTDFYELEQEWCALYPFAWADFHRFLAGWKPDHFKINDYMQAQTQKCLRLLSSDD